MKGMSKIMNYDKEKERLITIRYPIEEYEKMKAEAKALKMTLTKYTKLCVLAGRTEDRIVVEKVIKNTRKSDRLDIYTEDVNRLADLIIGPGQESRSTLLDRLLYTESQYPEKFKEKELDKLQKEVEKLNQNEEEIIKELQKILKKRKREGNKWLKNNVVDE